ncbi:MAG: dephospho-CoA kinase [bacterium]|nr:dephospho-CoA kinase [bacterium]
MPVAGLTGGIATGKSLVTDYMRRQGVVVIDADELARQIVEPGEPALEEIIDAFGADMLLEDGTLNREKLGGLIFQSAAERRRLEAIIHPRVYLRGWQKINRQRSIQPDRWLVFAVPLLFETGHDAEMDQVVLVYTDPATQLQRLMNRDGLSRESAALRIAAQMSIEVKKGLAHVVIDNSGTAASTCRQTDRLLARWKLF